MTRRRGHSPEPTVQYHRFVSRYIVQGDRGTATDKGISRAPLDKTRVDQRLG